MEMSFYDGLRYNGRIWYKKPVRHVVTIIESLFGLRSQYASFWTYVGREG